MDEQPTLPFVRGSATSKAAAESMVARLGPDEARVMALIRRPQGATDDEVEEITGMRHQTASARRRGLVLKGRVRSSMLKRPTRSGRAATVWIVMGWTDG